MKVVLTARNFGLPVLVRPGDEICMKLVENATTGFLWRSSNQDAAVLQPVSSTFELPEDRTAAGAAGNRTFVFSARKEGCSQLIFELTRAWLKDDRPAESGAIEVRVEGE